MKTAKQFFPEWALDNTNKLPRESFKFAEAFAKQQVEEALKGQEKSVITAMGMFRLAQQTKFCQHEGKYAVTNRICNKCRLVVPIKLYQETKS